MAVPLAVVAGAAEPHEATEQVTVHVTLGVVDGSPDTVAVKGDVLPDATLAEEGETTTETAGKVIDIVPVFVVSVTAVAVMVTVLFKGIGEGAVYLTVVGVCMLRAPAPEAGLRLQVTPAILVSLVTVAVIVMDWPARRFCDPLDARVMVIGVEPPLQPESTIPSPRISANAARTLILEFMSTPTLSVEIGDRLVIG